MLVNTDGNELDDSTQKDRGGSKKLGGLISPRLLSSRHGRHFRWKDDETQECEIDAEEVPSGDVDVVDIVDVEEDASIVSPDEESVVSTDADLQSRSAQSSGGLLVRQDSSRSGGEETSSNESPNSSSRANERRASIPSESECVSGASLSGKPEKSGSSSKASGAKMVRTVSCGDKLNVAARSGSGSRSPGATDRKNSGRRQLQRAARLSPQEFRSVMNSINEGSPRNENEGGLPPRSASSGVLSKSRSSDYNQTVMLSMSSSSSSSFSGDNSSKQVAAPLCHSASDEMPPTPRLATNLMSPPEPLDEPIRIGKVTGRAAEKSKHGHNRFFSLSVLKTAKNHAASKKNTSSNPASPLSGQKSVMEAQQEARLCSMTLDEVVKDPDLSSMFMTYLERMDATEGLEFLVRLEALKKHETVPGVDPYALHEEALILYEFFIREGTQKELNLSSVTRDDIETKLTAPKAEQLTQPSQLFQEARIEVYNMLGTNLYSQWLASLH